MKKLISLAAVCACIAAPALASRPAPHAKPVSHAKPAHPVAQAKLVCPVTGETIKSIKDAAGKSVYKGKTYYFCCGGCKPEFDKNPGKFLKKGA